MVNAFRYGFLGVSDVDVGRRSRSWSCAAVLLFTVA